MNMEALMQSFEIMGLGMLGIFGVIIAIMLVVTLLSRLTADKEEQ